MHIWPHLATPGVALTVPVDLSGINGDAPTTAIDFASYATAQVRVRRQGAAPYAPANLPVLGNAGNRLYDFTLDAANDLLAGVPFVVLSIRDTAAVPLFLEFEMIIALGVGIARDANGAVTVAGLAAAAKTDVKNAVETAGGFLDLINTRTNAFITAAGALTAAGITAVKGAVETAGGLLQLLAAKVQTNITRNPLDAALTQAAVENAGGMVATVFARVPANGATAVDVTNIRGDIAAVSAKADTIAAYVDDATGGGVGAITTQVTALSTALATDVASLGTGITGIANAIAAGVALSGTERTAVVAAVRTMLLAVESWAEHGYSGTPTTRQWDILAEDGVTVIGTRQQHFDPTDGRPVGSGAFVPG